MSDLRGDDRAGGLCEAKSASKTVVETKVEPTVGDEEKRVLLTAGAR